MTTFVSVGNATQPFTRLLGSVLDMASKLPQPVVVQHGNSPFAGTGCISLPFVDMAGFSSYIAGAELLILHAGAGSVIHAVKAGKIPVVMPRRAQYGEIVDDHQVEFVRALSAINKVVVAEEPDQLWAAVERALALQKKIEQRESGNMLLRLVDETLAAYAVQR